jgi:ABC-type Na+ efflux pump permease subunit
MRKALMLAKREYLAAVRTKGFIIALIIVPIMMSGSGLAMALLKDRVDTKDKRIALIDRSGVVGDTLRAVARRRNDEMVVNRETGKKAKPAYLFEVVEPNIADPQAQRLDLSNRVRSGELHAFLEIGPDVVHPAEDHARSRITYHAENAALDDIRGWLGWPVNNRLRHARLADVGVAEEEAQDLFRWISIDPLGLVSVDEETGQVQDARRSGEAEAVLVPIVLPMLMFMMVLMSALPLLSSVMEEKTQRIAEVLLGSVKPFEFMMGKVLGGVGVSLTAVTVYVVGGIITMRRLGVEEYVPYDVLPWFFSFMVLAILMLGAGYAALGSACNDAKEAQTVTFPAMLPVMIPMFVLMPIIQHPDSPFATWLSLFPPFTPMVMVLRLASPIGIPAWQPWLGLVLVLATAAFAVWAGGRIFRVAILMQGTPPKLANLLRWAVRG